jgi:hypothetical protein
VFGDGGNDVIIVTADTTFRPNGIRISSLTSVNLELEGNSGNDTIRVKYDGDMDGKLHIRAVLDGAVDLHGFNDPTENGEFRINMRTGSGRNSAGVPFDTANQVYEIRVEGGPGKDFITYVFNNDSAGAVVVREVPGFNFMLDGGAFDTDTLAISADGFVTDTNFEQSSAAFRNRAITAPVALGTPTTISGIPTDPDAGDTFILEVDWGDGTQQTYTLAPGSFVSGETVITVDHTYDHVGKYDVGLVWHDQLGLGNSDNTFVAWVLPPGGASSHQKVEATPATAAARPRDGSPAAEVLGWSSAVAGAPLLDEEDEAR